MVINNPKAEVYEATSGYLASKEYEIVLINPESPDHSHGFNPLAECQNEVEMEQIAEILLKCGSSSQGGKDEFWNNGAIRFVSLFIKCLANAGRDDPNVNNLANLYYLFQNFGQDGSPLDEWIAKYSINPDDIEDQTLWQEWKGVLVGNKEGVQSFVLNAITALKALSNRNIAQLTARSDFDMQAMRQKRMAIFFVTPPQHAEYYSFLTSVFFRSVFNACLREMPNKNTLPVYAFMDEFAHMTLPSFTSTANTIRGYKVSLSIVLQTISQLDARYGKEYAKAIQGGFGTHLTYASADPETAHFFETIFGRKRITQMPDYTAKNHNEHYREENLINSAEVRMIDEDQTLIVSANRNPVLTRATPYFKQRGLRKLTDCPRHQIKNKTASKLKFVSL
jgi:type IV secretion system protein VirD4